MSDALPPGLYRTTEAHPHNQEGIPAGTLVFLGSGNNTGGRFVVRPGRNEKNRWYWGEPTTPSTDPLWERTLKRLPAEGFYTLSEDLTVGESGVWRKNAIIQLGYNPKGEGIAFVAERHESDESNILQFSERGVKLSDKVLASLNWAPILPIAPTLAS